MTQSAPQNVTKEMNIELLNVINDDVQNVKQWTKMPAISDELYAELVKEFNQDSYYFFN
jgi:rRNA maturation endonuclease Nob1